MERKKITLRLPMELHRELSIISDQSGMTVTAVLLAAMWWHVLKPGGKRP